MIAKQREIKRKVVHLLQQERVRYVLLAFLLLVLANSAYTSPFSSLSQWLTKPTDGTDGKEKVTVTHVLVLLVSIFSIYVTLVLKKLPMKETSLLGRLSVGIKRITRREYDGHKAVTKREVDKLKKTQAYQQLLKSRGNKQEEWNWQTRESASKNKINDIIEFSGAALERAFLFADQQVHDEGGPLVKSRKMMSPTGWSSTRSSKKKDPQLSD